jgi:circadian clock protein KaiB
MTRSSKADKRRGGAIAPGCAIELRLYIAGNAPNSVRAIANLAAICKEFLDGRFTLEIVDVLDTPLRALADGILVTPTLARLAPSPPVRIVGNLDDRISVLHALEIA